MYSYEPSHLGYVFFEWVAEDGQVRTVPQRFRSLTLPSISSAALTALCIRNWERFSVELIVLAPIQEEWAELWGTLTQRLLQTDSARSVLRRALGKHRCIANWGRFGKGIIAWAAAIWSRFPQPPQVLRGIAGTPAHLL